MTDSDPFGGQMNTAGEADPFGAQDGGADPFSSSSSNSDLAVVSKKVVHLLFKSFNQTSFLL